MPNIAETLDKFKIPLALGLVGLVLIIGGMVVSSPETQEQFPKESLIETKNYVTVDVSGAVINPGVYKIDSNARVEDAIRAAGGLAEQASGEYVSKSLNMAQKLSDGGKIYIPYQGDPAPVNVDQGKVAGTQISSSVNINNGTQLELEALPGIGPVTAAKVISGRPYSKVSDLLDQKIVSRSVFEKIKDSIVIY